MVTLDPREQRFVEEYLIDLDPKRADAMIMGWPKPALHGKRAQKIDRTEVCSAPKHEPASRD